MLDLGFVLLVFVVISALVFDYVNGFHDTANAIATCVSTRALSIRNAIIMAAGLNFVGALISTKVASTIGKGIVDPQFVTQTVVLAGIVAAILWNIITWYYGLPSSSSHAIIGGILGAVISHSGWTAPHWEGLLKIIVTLVVSPVLGALFGFIVMVLIYNLFKRSVPSIINKNFRRLQVLSAGFMAFSHGTADAQKSMGIITLALVNYGAITVFEVPTWVKISCAVVMAFGTAAGGWRIIKTVGNDFVKLQPVHGFAAETSSAAVILGASAFGLPTSTTHVITSSILGVGLSGRLSAVNWSIGLRIVWAWFLTIPSSSLIGFLLYQIFSGTLKIP